MCMCRAGDAFGSAPRLHVIFFSFAFGIDSAIQEGGGATLRNMNSQQHPAARLQGFVSRSAASAVLDRPTSLFW